MATLHIPDALETDRLILLPRRVEEAAIYRRLWSERDARVPEHRRIDTAGRPAVADIAEGLDEAPGLLGVHRKDTAEVVGYCGLVVNGGGSDSRPELAFELLRAAQGRGYATEAGRAVIAWACATGQPRLWATVWDWNVASRKVLRKLEFRETSEVVSVSVHGHSLLATRALLAGSRPHVGSVAWHADGAAAGESGTR